MNIAIILSGGTGSRLGMEIPKQYLIVCGRDIISHSIETMSRSSLIDRIYIVAAKEWTDTIDSDIEKYDSNHKFAGYANPGENRQLSILSGLESIKNDMEKNNQDEQTKNLVIVHDAARPNITEKIIEDLINASKEHDGAMPVLPVKDTVYYSEDGASVSKLLERSKIYAGQAPEVFDYEKYLEANYRLLPDKILKINGSTEPAVMAGMDIALTKGDENNYKITTKTDLEKFIDIMSRNYINQHKME